MILSHPYLGNIYLINLFYRCYKTLLIRFKEKEYITNMLKILKENDTQDYLRCVADLNMSFIDFKVYEDAIKL